MDNDKERKLNRCKTFDYSLSGFYFITICIKDRIEYFGKIINEKMCFNKYGGLANIYMQLIPTYYNNVNIDCFVIMPNHIHAIVEITDSVVNKSTTVGTELNSVPTVVDHTNQTIHTVHATNKNYGLLSKIVKSYKHDFTKTIRGLYNNYDFKWQRSFHDRIIRDDIELNNKRNYIKNNPQKWWRDRNNLF